MVYELKFADIGEGIHEGEILKWHVKPGDSVKSEDIVVEVMTEKVNVEITSPVSGTVKELGKNEGDVINVGEILITFDETSSPTKDSTATTQSSVASKAQEKEKLSEKDDSLFTPSQPFVVSGTLGTKKSKDLKIINERPLAAPAVRKKARELGIDLRSVQGSGSGGRISHSDLEIYSQSTSSAVPSKQFVPTSIKDFVHGGVERVPLRGLRRAISQSMRRSKDHAAHFMYTDEVDMSSLIQLRTQAKSIGEEKGVKLTYLPFIIKGVISALKKFPYLNSSLDEEKEEIVLKKFFNIGVAVATEEGLIVPVVKHADQKDIWQLAFEVNDLANRARTKKLKLDDMQDGTFTITSIGGIGGLSATPVINYPEVGILGVMKIKDTPVVVEGEIKIKPMMNLCLSLDHRVVDGATGALFMNELIKYLENPALVFIDT